MSKNITKIVVHYSDGTTEVVSNTWTLPKDDPNTFTWPVNPATPAPWKTDRCSKCGLEIKGVMGYVCPNMDCPTGMGPVVC